MFTPEFINEEYGEFILVANHSLVSQESIKLSIAYNLARISGESRSFHRTFELAGSFMTSEDNQSLTKSKLRSDKNLNM